MSDKKPLSEPSAETRHAGAVRYALALMEQARAVSAPLHEPIIRQHIAELASLHATLRETAQERTMLQTQLAGSRGIRHELDEMLAACARERDEWKTLASVGVWHADCRPNRLMAAETIAKQQATIDKLADTISALSARAEAAEATLTAAQNVCRDL